MLLLLLIAVLAPASATPAVTFQDVALEAGFQDRLSHGRALVAADFNGDGYTDFFLGNPSSPLGTDDDSFILWSNGVGPLGEPSFTKGPVLLKGALAFTASAADYDEDGDPDLFVGIGGQEGIGLDVLFRNDGGSFVDVSDTAGIQGSRTEAGQLVPTATSSGSWADYDNDGDLDLFVARRYKKQSLDLPGDLGWKDTLFRNEGDGTFTDVTQQSGIDGTESSMTASWGDYDNDGWMDLYVPHPSIPSRPGEFSDGFRLYRNQQDGTFADAGVDEADVAFGVSANWASCTEDMDNNGFLDILSFGRREDLFRDEDHALLMNSGGWEFVNEGAKLSPGGVTIPNTMGCQIGDMDNDGFPEVVLANGGPLEGEIDRLLQNTTTHGGPVSFTDRSALLDVPAPDDPSCVDPTPLMPSGSNLVNHEAMDHGEVDDGVSEPSGPVQAAAEGGFCHPPYPYRGHAVVFTDVDKDGDLDLAMSKGGTEIIAPTLMSTEPNRLFMNHGGNDANWLFLELLGQVSNADAIGARIEVTASDSGASPRKFFKHMKAGSCFSSSGPREIHVGLGTADTIDQITVRWPSGVQSVLEGVAINQRLIVREPIVEESDFNDGDLGAWAFPKGIWSVADGQLVQTASGSGVALLATSSVLDDYAVAAKLTYVSGQKSLSLLARVDRATKSFYGAMLSDGSAQLFKVIAGLPPVFLGTPITIARMNPGRSYIVGIELSGSSLKLTVDGEPGPVVTDSEIASGTVGVRTSVAKVDHVAIYDPRLNPTP